MSVSEVLWLGAGWSILAIVDLLAILIVAKMASGDIDLTMLISEPTGDASLSRFQFLIFTFVVALALFLVTVKKGDFPVITGGILSLLGISASTYAVSKGIQFSADEGIREKPPIVEVSPKAVTLGPGGNQQFAADISPSSTKTVTWSIDPAIGSIGQDGRYSAPAEIAMAATVAVRATSAADHTVSDAATVRLDPAAH